MTSYKIIGQSKAGRLVSAVLYPDASHFLMNIQNIEFGVSTMCFSITFLNLKGKTREINIYERFKIRKKLEKWRKKEIVITKY